MAYGSNILKKEAAYYSLVNATIINGILHIGAGGSATQTLSVSDLPAVTKNMLFTCISDNEYSNHYVPDIQVIVYTKMNSDVTYSKAILYPVQVAPNKYSCEFTMEEGSYDEMYVTLTAQKSVNLILWELCAEAADESAIVEIEGVKQALAKLLYDYNTGIFTGDNEETTIAFITCWLIQNTDVQGHLIFTFSNTHACCMTIRFYDNDSEELFTPLYYDLKSGNNSIGIPHAFLNRLAGRHNFYVTAQVSSGTFTVPVRGALFTIDAGYLAKREIDLAMDICDIAIRQLVADNGPNEIWAVGLDKSIAYVRYRKYKEDNANVGWTAVGSLGKALYAAIEFDGNWVLRTNEDQYTLETEEIPYIFIVDERHNLYAYHGIDDEVPVLLDTDVSTVKACKGYSSNLYPEQDQGLVVVYTKTDHHAYYRRYYYIPNSDIKVWETAQAFNGLWDFANVHRLNDYRLGITLSNDSTNLWKYTDRTYVGQAAYPEKRTVGGIYHEEGLYKNFIGYYTLDQLPEGIAIENISYEIIEAQTAEEQDQILFTIIVNRALFGSEIYKNAWDRVTYSNNLTDVVNVEWIPNMENNTTTIKLTSLMPMKYLQYTFNIVGDSWLRYYENGMLQTFATTLTGVLDLRAFYTVKEGAHAITGITERSITYDGFETIKTSQGEEDLNVLRYSTSTITYSTVEKVIPKPIEDTHTNTRYSTQNIAYYDIHDAPV